MFKRLIIGVNGTESDRDAIALGRALAEPDAHVGLANIYGAGLMTGHAAGALLAAELELSCKLLESERRTALPTAQIFPFASHRVGDGLHVLGRRYDADLLVVGSSRRGIVGRVLLGDDMLESLNGASCAVAIVPSGYGSTEHPLRIIGLGYDGSPASWYAHHIAREIAANYDAEIRSLAVATDRAPGAELATLGDQVDLLIVGSRGDRRVKRWLHGSTSNYLAQHAHCPLLVVPRSATAVPRAARTEQDEESVSRLDQLVL